MENTLNYIETIKTINTQLKKEIQMQQEKIERNITMKLGRY